MAFFRSSKLISVWTSFRSAGVSLSNTVIFPARRHDANSRHSFNRLSATISSGLEMMRTLPSWIWKESSIMEYYLIHDDRQVPRKVIRISPFWIGVSSSYLLLSLLVAPFSAVFATVLRVPIGIFLLYAIRNPFKSEKALRQIAS